MSLLDDKPLSVDKSLAVDHNSIIDHLTYQVASVSLDEHRTLVTTGYNSIRITTTHPIYRYTTTQELPIDLNTTELEQRIIPKTLRFLMHLLDLWSDFLFNKTPLHLCTHPNGSVTDCHTLVFSSNHVIINHQRFLINDETMDLIVKKFYQIAWNQYVRHEIPNHVRYVLHQAVIRQGAPAIIQLTKLLPIPPGVAQIICDYANWHCVVRRSIQKE